MLARQALEAQWWLLLSEWNALSRSDLILTTLGSMVTILTTSPLDINLEQSPWRLPWDFYGTPLTSLPSLKELLLMEQSLLTLLKQMWLFIYMVSVSCHQKAPSLLCISSFSLSLPPHSPSFTHHSPSFSSPLFQPTPSQFILTLFPPSSVYLVTSFSTLPFPLTHKLPHNILHNTSLSPMQLELTSKSRRTWLLWMLMHPRGRHYSA